MSKYQEKGMGQTNTVGVVRPGKFKTWLSQAYEYDPENGYYYSKNEYRRPCFNSRDKRDMEALLRQFTALKNRGKV